MDVDAALRWYERWLQAWNEQRPEMCHDLLTDDFVLSTPTLRNADGPVVGPAACADYLRYVIGMYPDLVWERTGPPMLSSDSVAGDGTRAAFTWRGTGHFTGRMDPPGIDGTGAAFDFTGVEVFDFSGDRARHLDVSYDLLGLLTQVGVLGRGRARR
jgi:hypothetical protein